ncbi:MAG: Flp pilus assembly complex ATPase component TadA [Elusimicrobia bacterium]|nr:Flp pilus assembly complex ATPase component TadA [Elusimicrobiota bacterium]
MTTEPRYKDDWILKAVETLGLPPDVLDGIRKSGEPSLAQALLRGKTVTWDQLAAAVTETFGIPCIDLSIKNVEKMALSLLTPSVCENLQLLPLHLNNNVISVAMGHPLDAAAKDHVRLMSAREVEPCFALPEKIEALIAECYSDNMRMVDLIEKLDMDETMEVVDVDGKVNRSLDAAGTMERFVNDVITKAVALEAAEIHLEHGRNASEIRFLIDGMLRTILTLPKPMAEGPIATRFKALAGLDVSEHLRPQEGRVNLRVAGREVGLRLFTRPSVTGERLTLRVLDERVAARPLETLGFRPALIEKLLDFGKAAQGALLVTGPAGSGKTTLLYALLTPWHAAGAKSATVEDPIEFKIPGIPQVQVNEKLGLNYATALRAALRNEPRLLLVGELRDAETANVAFQAAGNGRIVVSSLHTEDAFAGLNRLIDMGLAAERFAPVLKLILSQRLVRRLCPACRKPVEEKAWDPAVVAAFKAEDGDPAYQRASGCEECNFSGYRGRLALVELLEINEEVQKKILSGASPLELHRVALETDAIHTFHADALWHLASGDTTLSEVQPYLELEIRKSIADKSPDPKPADAAVGDTPKLRVLVTDDDPLIRTIVRKTLETQGYVVEEAADGLQALAMAAEKAPDLMLLDLDMPGIDGFGVLRMLRRKMGMVKLPVIMLTATDDDRSQEYAISLGADDYVAKPVKPGIILARIGAVFRRAALSSY